VHTSRLLGIAFGLAALAASSAARANGRYPTANQIAFMPNDPSTMVTRSTFGLLVSHDQGASWDWVCEQALGFSMAQDPSVGLLGRSAIAVGTYGGLVTSLDTGCGWGFVGGALSNVPVVDIVVRRDAPANAYVLLSKYVPSRDGGSGSYATQVFATTDGAATWSALGAAIDPTYFVETIEVAKSDPLRLYVSATAGYGASTTAWLLVSRDHGASWTPRAIPFDPMREHAPYIAAVDPSNADQVYVRNGGGSTSRLFVTTDAGATFGEKWSGGAMLGFALREDGAKVYVGGATDGVQVASTSDFVFTKTSSTPVQCLASHGATLYACSGDKTGGFAVGASEDDGATFRPVLHLSDVRGPLACAPSTAEAQCSQYWPGIHGVLTSGSDAGADAATFDAGAADAAVADTGETKSVAPMSSAASHGCSESSSANGAAPLALAIATMLAMRARTRLRTERTRRARRTATHGRLQR
jgi:hypothetical protein